MRSSPPPLLLVFFSVGLSQSHLVYPPPTDVTPTKVQLIFGLGIPMEIEASTIVGYVLKANYNLPYNSTVLTEPYVRYQKRSIERSTSATSRYDLYRMLEQAKLGKACLLRCICELAATPLRDRRSSILAQLVHVLFTPSSTRDDDSAEADDWIEWSDQEYHAAELLGRRHRGTADVCSRNFAECQISILSYFTDYYRDHYDDVEEEQQRQEISD
ncbi:uncharacterized protein LOC106653588 [Trichogramma pretiosum]|uniref:uncharacterized protein LOC106653588 n=1 Tax=Trichogramma pretiosum TaxID=7493 RepID=UPI0006C974CE|nr:uncharacterized protein LOC106653588 [Trichogramma pretiosum]